MNRGFFLRIGTALILMFPSAFAAQAEEIRLTTYYPAPLGEYDDLTANRLTVRNDTRLGTLDGRVGIGLAREDQIDARLHISSGDVYVEEGNVGIGTLAPAGRFVVNSPRRDQSNNLLAPIVRVENLQTDLQSPTRVGGGSFAVTVASNDGTTKLGTCENPFPAGWNGLYTMTIQCQRTYRPAMTLGQVDNWGLTDGKMGLLAYALNSGAYGVESGVMKVNGSSVEVPWPADQIAIMGISNSVGVYGLGMDSHPGVVGYSKKQYGVYGIVGPQGQAAVFGDGGASAHAIQGISRSGSGAIFGVNYGSGPSINGWKATGVGGVVADFNSSGVDWDDYAVHAYTDNAVAINARSSYKSAIFATNDSGINWNSDPGFRGVVTIQGTGTMLGLGVRSGGVGADIGGTVLGLRVQSATRGAEISGNVRGLNVSASGVGAGGSNVLGLQVDSNGKGAVISGRTVGLEVIGTGAGGGDSFAATVTNNTDTNNSNHSDGMLIQINRSKNSITDKNSFIEFRSATGGYLGSIRGSNNAVRNMRLELDNIAVPSMNITTGNGADYAEYIIAEEIIEPGYLVGINLETGRARKWQMGDPLVGVTSTHPAFIGNTAGETAEEPHVLVALVGMVDIKDTEAVTEGRIVKTPDGQRVGYLLADGKVILSIK
ncbi:MAG: hypothetical protein HYY14_01990 [Candidatus Omnitrophica bacterium]|nr:hypothetical protein [Candidatus Omnitrophota bacterium]